MTRSISSKSDEKKRLRQEIDALDRTIVNALEKRFSCVAKLAPLKDCLTDKKREEEILAKIASSEIQEIYHAIFKTSKKMLRQLQKNK